MNGRRLRPGVQFKSKRMQPREKQRRFTSVCDSKLLICQHLELFCLHDQLCSGFLTRNKKANKIELTSKG